MDNWWIAELQAAVSSFCGHLSRLAIKLKVVPKLDSVCTLGSSSRELLDNMNLLTDEIAILTVQ